MTGTDFGDTFCQYMKNNLTQKKCSLKHGFLSCSQTISIRSPFTDFSKKLRIKLFAVGSAMFFVSNGMFHHRAGRLATGATELRASGSPNNERHGSRIRNADECWCNRHWPKWKPAKRTWPTVEQCVETHGRKSGGIERVFVFRC